MLLKLLAEAKALLFDFDGVIADSEPFYYRSYDRAFRKRGHSIREEDYWEYWTSRGEGIAGEAKRQGIPFSEEEMKVMYAERREHYSAFCREGAIPFFPGMLDALLLLKKKGVPCIVASSSFEGDILTLFEKAGHAPPPCPVVGRRACLLPKPDPDIFVYAAGALGAAPADCLVFEDAHKGLEAAKTVGMKCMILKNRYNRNLNYADADAVAESHEAFLQAIRAL